MKRTQFTLALVLLCCVLAGAQPRSDEAAVAYSRNGVLTVTTDSGKVLRTIKTTVPMGDFTISEDASKVVFIRLNPKTLGGPLYLLTVSTGKIQRLTRGPYFSKNSRSEVYADPDLSPNGDEAVFAIHAQATGDAVETAGPAATVYLKTRMVRLLPGTKNVNGSGAAFANDPSWSPDGNQIVVNFEDHAALTNREGAKLRDLSGMMVGGDWTHVLSWLGPDCLIYVAGNDAKNAESAPAQVLNLRTAKVESAARAMGIPEESTAGLVAISPSIRIRRDGKQLVVEGSQPRWTIPYEEGVTFARLVPRRQNRTQLPAACNSQSVGTMQ